MELHRLRVRAQYAATRETETKRRQPSPVLQLRHQFLSVPTESRRRSTTMPHRLVGKQAKTVAVALHRAFVWVQQRGAESAKIQPLT